MPASERALRAQLERFAATSPVARHSVIADTRGLGLGRFIEPAMRRLMGPGRQTELLSLAAELVTCAIQTPLPPRPPSRSRKLSC